MTRENDDMPHVDETLDVPHGEPETITKPCAIEDNAQSKSGKKWLYLAVVTIIEVVVVLAIVLPITLTRRKNKASSAQLEPTRPPWYSPTTTWPTVASKIDITPIAPVTLKQVGQTIVETGNFGILRTSTNGLKLATSTDGQLLITFIQKEVNAKKHFSVQAYSFYNATSTWLTRGSAIEGDAVGFLDATAAVSSDGNTIAIGTVGFDGTIRVFRFDSATSSWPQVGNEIVYSYVSQEYALALSADGTFIASGDASNTEVQVYRFDSASWQLIGKPLTGYFPYLDGFGSSVALSDDGQVVAVGARQYVRVFAFGQQRNSEFGWNEIFHYFVEVDGPGNRSEYDVRGNSRSVSLSGDGTTLAVGGVRSRDLTQSDYVIPVKANWVFMFDRGSLESQNLELDFYGEEVALSSDGKILTAASPTKTTVFASNGLNYTKIGSTPNFTDYGITTLAFSKDASTIVEGFTNENGTVSIRVYRTV